MGEWRYRMELAFNLSLFPANTEVNGHGHLVIGSCDTVQLARDYGTPMYIFDEHQLRHKCQEFKNDFNRFYPDTIITYASKAYINKALALIFKEEGLGLDVVSGGELSIIKSVDYPLEKVYFHGNNKSTDELRLALKWRVGRIVVDNFYELNLLEQLAAELTYKPSILLRLTPGVDPHTHKFISTGNIDSKFGFPSDSREKAVTVAMAASHLDLVGLHFHVGSLIFESKPFTQAAASVLDFAAEMKKKYGFKLKEFNVGGGYAIQYVSTSPAPPASYYARAISNEIISKCRELKLERPRMTIEPGRAIVGQAGIALYTVGAIKDIPGVRRYVSVDGGMADNIRPAIYGSVYEAALANKAAERKSARVTIAGKFCESGDILINDIEMPLISSGDIIAIPDCGAYCLAMASNYNASLKPPIVMVRDGKARLIRRRETFEDLVRNDLV
jgi:diaminopimelate decarboxylase